VNKTVLFDLGGVLINWKDDWLYDEISSQIHKPFSQIKSKFDDNLCSLFESRINESEFWDKVLGSNIKIDKKIISKIFLKKSTINEEFLNFAKSLPMKGCSIGILSNLTPETSKHVKKNILENFDYHFYSNLLKMSKPNSEIYQYVCDQIPSEKILFIDDKQENLDAAKLFGIDTLLFTSNNYQSGLIEEKILNYLN